MEKQTVKEGEQSVVIEADLLHHPELDLSLILYVLWQSRMSIRYPFLASTHIHMCIYYTCIHIQPREGQKEKKEKPYHQKPF